MFDNSAVSEKDLTSPIREVSRRVASSDAVPWRSTRVRFDRVSAGRRFAAHRRVLQAVTDHATTKKKNFLPEGTSYLRVPSIPVA